MDRSTARYAHNSRPQQRKGEDAANPRLTHGGQYHKPNPAYLPKGLPIAYKTHFPLYPYLQ